MSEPIVVSGPVREALAERRPVVALESTIFTHGLTRPRNVAVALAAEQQLRDAGAVPATVGVVDGVPTVGLSEEQAAYIQAPPPPSPKARISLRWRRFRSSL